ncbi:MAG: DUF502 domain-containing protein [Phycisphaeraceae bacterium]
MTDTPDQNPMPADTTDESGGQPDIEQGKPVKKGGKSTRFIIRGMATLLPAVLTLWLLVFAYGFVRDKIAAPINWGVQGTVIKFTDWPVASDEDYADVWQSRAEYLTALQEQAWEIKRDEKRETLEKTVPNLPGSAIEAVLRDQRLAWMKDQPEIVLDARRVQLQKKWNSIAVGNWHVLDLIGLIIAVVLFYFAGVLMSNVIGRQLKHRGEKIIDRVPLIRRVYPAVKQVTDFFFGDNDEDKLKFNRVVAVEYPRKGLYSVGLVTGDTMRMIEDAMGEPCLTVFVPSSPTPFTGYVITVPVKDTIDLGISIEDALKFAVSGGVLVPPSQMINRDADTSDRRGSTGDRRALPEAKND